MNNPVYIHIYIYTFSRDESKISKVSGKFSPSNNSWRDCVYLSSPRNNRKFSFILQGRWGSLRVAWKEGKEFAQVSKTVPFAIRACEMQALLSNSAAVEFIIDLSARRVAIFSGSSDSRRERESYFFFLSGDVETIYSARLKAPVSLDGFFFPDFHSD